MHNGVKYLAAVAGALALAACSDSTTSPVARSVAPSAASLSVTPGTNSFTIASDAGSQYCPTAAQLGVFTTFPATYAPIGSGCIAAQDIETDGSLGAYNPGWDQLTGGHWIGFTVNGGPSSDYRPTPGIYVFQQTFTLPSNITAPTLTLNVRADNVVAVYLNGHKLGQQAMVDCNDGAFGPCHWTAGGQLTVTDNTASDFVINGLNTLTFLVNDVPTGFPDVNPPPGGKGGPAPQYGCTTRTPQLTGSHLFTGDNAVTTLAGHAGPLPTGNAMSPTPTLDVANPTQVGCENPAGLAFVGSVSWTPPSSTTWCSPGFWKNHEELWTAYWGTLYSSLSGAAPFGKKAPAGDPTIKTVVENPSIYGGPATNSVADYLSNIFFGTPIGSGIESCPDPNDFPTIGN